MKNGALVISLDFELMWGVFDNKTIGNYGKNIQGVQVVIPRLLSLFNKYDIRVTWATVGFLFHKNFQEFDNHIPVSIAQYDNAALNPYLFASKLDRSQKDIDSYFFAPALIDSIRNTPGQEMATHTYSHYYCLEKGGSLTDFKADIEAAIAIHEKWGLPIKSIVFPRNQYSKEHVEVMHQLGIKCYRGNEDSRFYKPVAQDQNSYFRRGIRFINRYFPVLGHHQATPQKENGVIIVPSSSFLSPYSKTLKILEPLKIWRIKNSMRIAAKEKKIYHLWWHPHNMGINIEENLAQLEDLLQFYTLLRSQYQMESLNMSDFIDRDH